MKRTVGSGSEPTYLPVMSYTSCRGLVLFCASAPEAVPAIRTRAMAVLVNMVISCRGVAHTLLVCACIYCAPVRRVNQPGVLLPSAQRHCAGAEKPVKWGFLASARRRAGMLWSRD